jgi:TolA-binding protein
MLSLSIDTELFRYMIWMLIGIVAFGFGILYMNRMGEESSLYQGEVSIEQNAAIPPIQALPETNIQPVQQMQEENVEHEIESEQDLEEVEEQHEFDEELDKAFQDIEAKDEENVEQAIPAPVKQTETIPKAKPIAKKASTNVPVNQPLFDVQLDPQVLSIIQQRIANTPHLGYRPVVQVMKNGNVNLTFIKL